MTAIRMRKTYFGQFTYEKVTDHTGKDFYYDHLPVYTGAMCILMALHLVTVRRMP